MIFFKDSDKYGTINDFLPEQKEFELMDVNQDLPASFGSESEEFFGRFTHLEIKEMLEESTLIEALVKRGYNETRIEIIPHSFYDNRIYINDASTGLTLVHIRLKVDDLFLKKINQSLKMVYIDWLLTQNIRWNIKPFNKKLFEGQEYPGLNIMKEIENFMLILSKRLGAHAIFNVPEYFHDAVLFHKNFKFLDPEKEGIFRAVLKNFHGTNLRKLSDLIHKKRIYIANTAEIYTWKHGEMLFVFQPDIVSRIFDKEYHEKVANYTKYQMRILNKTVDLIDYF
jgi:hypothetical protein